MKLMPRGARPSLASKETVEVLEPRGAHGALSAGDNPIHLPSTPSKRLGERFGSLVRALLGISVVSAVLAAAIYVALAATVMIVAQPFALNAVVMRGAYPVGQAPAGAVVLVGAGKAATDTLGKLQEGVVGIKAASVVSIVAGPYGKVNNNSRGQILVNHKPTGYWAPLDARTLARQYVAICIRGACKPGTAVLVGERAIVGKVKGYVSTSGTRVMGTFTPATGIPVSTRPPVTQ